jgi:hypothetical protein
MTKNTGANSNKAASLRQFSSTNSAGQTTLQCSSSPAQASIPEEPCNLEMLQFIEPEADCGGKKQQRVVIFRSGQICDRRASPTQLGSGDKFQITANSAINAKPRQIEMEIVTQADCSGSIHPWARWEDFEGSNGKVAKKANLSFYRQPMGGDNSRWGFFVMLNSVFGLEPVQYSVSANCCGIPLKPGGGSTENMGAVIEVFPGDQYSAELSIPAFLKPDALDYSKASKSWTTSRDRDKEKIEKASGEAEEIYVKEKDFFREIGVSKKEFRDFAESMEKKKLGYVEGNPEGLKIKLSQVDGTRTLEANVDEVIKLIRLIRQAEYRFKEFNEWIESLQVGPGVRFKAECQFLAIKFVAQWGYTEYVDDRVFLRYSGSLDIDIVKASLEGSFGFKSAGLCDLILVLKGEGTIGITVPQITKETPDDPPRGEVKPRGELKFSGGVEGTLLWAAKAEGKLEVVFKATTEELKVLSEKSILSGKIVVSREPLEAIVTASCVLYGTTSRKFELVKADPQLAEFEF